MSEQGLAVDLSGRDLGRLVSVVDKNGVRVIGRLNGIDHGGSWTTGKTYLHLKSDEGWRMGVVVKAEDLVDFVVAELDVKP